MVYFDIRIVLLPFISYAANEYDTKVAYITALK